MITIHEVNEAIDSLDSITENKSAILIGALVIKDIANEYLEDELVTNNLLREEIDSLKGELEGLQEKLDRINNNDTMPTINTLLDTQKAEICKRMFDALTLEQLDKLERFAYRDVRFTTTDKSVINDIFSSINK